MGPVRGGTLDEAGYPYLTIGIDRCVETGFRQVPLACFAPNSKFGRTGLCKYLFSLQRYELYTNEMYKGIFALPPGRSFGALVIHHDADHGSCIT